MIKLAKLKGKPEIFYSIQGEGKNIGQPSIFVRLSLCNLYCVWCDTDYTWNWENTDFDHEKKTKYRKNEWIVQLSDEEIISEIEKHNCQNLVITGGEPLVQHKDLLSLFQKIKRKSEDFRIEFETNGTLIPSQELDQLSDQYNVSLKLSNSKVDHKDRLNSKAIEFFVKSSKSNFKFVIDKEEDLAELQELITEFSIPNDKIYLMPQGMTSEALNQKEKWLVEICKKYNYNYTSRLHIQIYGDKKGV